MSNKTSEQKTPVPQRTEREQCDEMAAEGPKPTRPPERKRPREGDPDYVPPE